MRKSEVDALSKILSDPGNDDLTAEEVAERAISALDDLRARSHRLAVVGQIRYGPQEETHTVILGPFASRGVLDSREKFLKAVEGGTAAREVGQHLAWDTRTGCGEGRFMLAPAFLKPRDAWDFFRGEGPAEAVTDAVEMIPRSVGPVCTCGMEGHIDCRFCGAPYARHCFQHEPEAEPHRCQRAA